MFIELTISEGKKATVRTDCITAFISSKFEPGKTQVYFQGGSMTFMESYEEIKNLLNPNKSVEDYYKQCNFPKGI